jgi:hypothetical protein
MYLYQLPYDLKAHFLHFDQRYCRILLCFANLVSSHQPNYASCQCSSTPSILTPHREYCRYQRAQKAEELRRTITQLNTAQAKSDQKPPQ